MSGVRQDVTPPVFLRADAEGLPCMACDARSLVPMVGADEAASQAFVLATVVTNASCFGSMPVAMCDRHLADLSRLSSHLGETRIRERVAPGDG